MIADSKTTVPMDTSSSTKAPLHRTRIAYGEYKGGGGGGL